MQHVQLLESDLARAQINHKHKVSELSGDLSRTVRQRDEALTQSELVVEESREVHARRTNLIMKLEDEARSRIKMEAVNGDLQKELHLNRCSHVFLLRRTTN
jgi:hypothetical protein